MMDLKSVVIPNLSEGGGIRQFIRNDMFRIVYEFLNIEDMMCDVQKLFPQSLIDKTRIESYCPDQTGF